MAILSLFTSVLLVSSSLNVLAHPHHTYKHAGLFAKREQPTCRAEISHDDYSAKRQEFVDLAVCEVDSNPLKAILARQSVSSQPDDYSCSESKPCKNGACCSKKTGYCNYGPDACGPNLGSNPSPNDVCWSNCDAVAECGKYALPAGKTCPLNVCCSEYGFCGMTSDFCGDGCQSKCTQPGSGASGSDVKKKVIGYYEAWAHDRKCQSMDFKQIPAESLTHLHFSFGYVTPGDFNIAPMDDLSQSLFSALTDVKNRNSGLQAIVALGGWTFNDNGTSTQPVFSSICSTAGNRAKFITNLMAFMREYAFDGVDFDWEYPGAPDRGGHPDDGKNFVSLLSELQTAIAASPVKYTVSFTAPTSYWYLRWFDLSAHKYVDHINVMSYDLHGIWDSTNPIGSTVLAHTNLTEIKQAFDLFWRNDVPAEKLNLGVGFYGRSFQLSNPSCYKPGCQFKGGASPGSCTNNAGTLSYREIMSVIKQYDLKPYHDETDAVKYITWNQDQWVSYDDADTFKQKTDWAESVGLGGILIWSIDQDTDDLEALSGLLGKKVALYAREADSANAFKDATATDCYVTDCGGTCKAGTIPITKQPCGGAKPVTRHSKEADSTLCCPVESAPDPKQCTWRGTAPGCNGHCHDGEVVMELNKWGDGKYCEGGNKAYCCKTPKDADNKCYWTGAGKDCNSGDTLFTFKGTFLQTIVDIIDIFPPSLFGLALEDTLSDWNMDNQAKYCCPPDDAKKWTNCQWYGDPGKGTGCDDNHCPVGGRSVMLTSSDYGLGISCFPRFERTRVYCCDATGNGALFSPVPLEDLFPSPPTGDNVDQDFKLQTQGGDPDTSAFGFVVLASPEELQTSLDKRDGSDWEIFGCDHLDQTSEEEHTIQIYCGNEDSSAYCDKIFLGQGAPGTIVELPDGCGPSRYAVAKSMVPSEKQEFASHLEKRTYAHKPTIYDLTFDFEWKRVPRDAGGETQMRLDYSNMNGYWDSIVDKPGNHKVKRTLDDYNGNHKRWLEDEWRDDFHNSGLDIHELHKRWFGSDVIDWLKGFFNPTIQKSTGFNFKDQFTAKLVDEKWKCNIQGADVEARLLIQALMTVNLNTDFGITIIATLGGPNGISFQDSYLYFKNDGDINAIFSLDALGKVSFDKTFELLNLANFPGATFGIPKLVTVGPNFRMLGSIDAEVQLAAKLESRANIAKWNVESTWPAANGDYMPKKLSAVNVDGTGDFTGLLKPTFDSSVSAMGSLSAHIKPMVEFGIVFPIANNLNSVVQIIADGSVTFSAKASTGSCPFEYGVDVGARLYMHVDAPSFAGWNIPDFDLLPMQTKSPISNTCPTKREIDDWYSGASNISTQAMVTRDAVMMEEVGLSPLALGGVHQYGKRSGVKGPALVLPKTGCLFCPGGSANPDDRDCAKVTGWDDFIDPDETSGSGASKRELGSVEAAKFDPETGAPVLHTYEKRKPKKQKFCQSSSAEMEIISPDFWPSGQLVPHYSNAKTYGYGQPQTCNDYTFGVIPTPSNTRVYATEHILEYQLLQHFLNDMESTLGQFNDPAGGGGKVDFCDYIRPYWYENQITYNGKTDKATQILAYAYPGKTQYTDEWVMLDAQVNKAKEGMWGTHEVNADTTMEEYELTAPEREVKNLKDVLTAYKYHTDSNIASILKKQRDRVATTLTAIENALAGKSVKIGNTQYGAYKSIGLAAKWNTWSSDRLKLAKSKADTHLSTYFPQLKEGYATQGLRTAAQKAASAGDNGPQELIGKIDALEAALNQKPTWTLNF